MKIHVTLSRSNGHDEVSALVAKAARRLVDDLGVAVDVECDVGPGKEDTVVVDGVPLAAGLTTDGDGSADALAWAVMSALTRERRMLVETALGSTVPPAHRELAGELAERCISRARLDEAAGPADGSDREFAESLLDTASVNVLAAHLRPGVADRLEVVADLDEAGAADDDDSVLADDISGSLAGLGDVLREQLGVPSPVWRMLPDPDQPLLGDRRLLGLKINDVRFPAVTGKAEGVAQMFIDAFLAVAALVTLDSTRFALFRLRSTHPDLVDAVQELFPLPVITTVVRRLAEERLDVGRLRAILDSLLAVAGGSTVDEARRVVGLPHVGTLYPGTSARDVSELTPAQLTECVRMSLARQISGMARRGGERIYAHVAAASTCEVAASQPEGDFGVRQEIVERIARTIEDPDSAVIVAPTYARRSIWAATHVAYPELQVVGYLELMPDADIEKVGDV